MSHKSDALRISPNYDVPAWKALKQGNPAHWKTAAEMVHDRLHGRFLKFANKCLEDDEFSGFVVLSIDCLFAETLQQFCEGITGHEPRRLRPRTGDLFKRFLSGPRFQPDFENDDAKVRFYEDIRCGLLHQAEAKRKWLIRRCEPQMLSKIGEDAYVLDVKLFHSAILGSLEDFCRDLVDEEQGVLRENVWKKMDGICDMRNQRSELIEE